jgi:hypothetical protein
MTGVTAEWDDNAIVVLLREQRKFGTHNDRCVKQRYLQLHMTPASVVAHTTRVRCCRFVDPMRSGICSMHYAVSVVVVTMRSSVADRSRDCCAAESTVFVSGPDSVVRRCPRKPPR